VSAIDATTTPTQLSMELGGLVATWKTIQVLETVSDQAQRIREREEAAGELPDWLDDALLVAQCHSVEAGNGGYVMFTGAVVETLSEASQAAMRASSEN